MALVLSDISTSTLLSIWEKYAKAIVTRKLRWSYCDMCFEVMARIGEDTNYCLDCPLWQSAWCRSIRYVSRLSPDYIGRSFNSNRMVSPMLRWERDVTVFLKWISEELIRRGVDLIK